MKGVLVLGSLALMAGFGLEDPTDRVNSSQPTTTQADATTAPASNSTTQPTDSGAATRRHVRAPRSPEFALAGFTGSKHDFYGPSAPLAQRCSPCHPGPPDKPNPGLWSSTFEHPSRLTTAGPEQRLADSTRLCLSCHDATIASEIVGGGQSVDLHAPWTFGNVRRDHPVGVPYPPLGRTPGKFRREYHSIAKLESEGRIRLPGGRVECVSCHDPHNGYGLPAMLVKSDRRSGLCLSCHIK